MGHVKNVTTHYVAAQLEYHPRSQCSHIFQKGVIRSQSIIPLSRVACVAGLHTSFILYKVGERIAFTMMVSAAWWLDMAGR